MEFGANKSTKSLRDCSQVFVRIGAASAQSRGSIVCEPSPVGKPDSLARFARLPVVVAAASAAGGQSGRDADPRRHGGVDAAEAGAGALPGRGEPPLALRGTLPGGGDQLVVPSPAPRVHLGA